MVPQSPEFHPGGHTVIHRSPHPPLPGFIPVPTMMPPPPRHMYSVTGAGDMATQYMPQYPSSQVYADVGKIPLLPCLVDIKDSLFVSYKRITHDNDSTVVFCYQALLSNFVFMI